MIAAVILAALFLTSNLGGPDRHPKHCLTWGWVGLPNVPPKGLSDAQRQVWWAERNPAPAASARTPKGL